VHERSVAEDLVRAAGVTAVEEGGVVRTMRITVGSLSCIDPGSLRDQIAWYARGTVAEGASVEVEVRGDDIGDPHARDVRLTAIEVG
jgi:Zn finger protein HypA/HybF involved in hydrogenase expression